MNHIENNQEIESLEAQFPAASGVAFSNARAQVLASGQSVLQSEGGAIYEVFPDGQRRFVKTVEPPSPVIVRRRSQGHIRVILLRRFQIPEAGAAW